MYRLQNGIETMVEENHKSTGGRRYRLKQLKKILPSDRISIEKHFPRFYEKCQKIQMQLQQQQQQQLKPTWIVQNLTGISPQLPRRNDGADNRKRAIKNNLVRENHLESRKCNRNGEDVWTCRQSTLQEENLKNKESARNGADLEDKPDPPDPLSSSKDLVVPMADHLEEMTLHRGCWLQATLSSQQRQEIGQDLDQQKPKQPPEQQPKIVFIHRKTSTNQLRSRADLAREVLEEFERQKLQLVRRCSTVEHTLNPLTFQRSNYQKSLPIFNRPSIIHLQSRRVS